MASSPDVLVIGGGVIGLTSAYFLAKAGLSVGLIERGELGREASWAGAGIVPPGMFPDRTTTPLDRLRAYSVSRFPALSEELRDFTGIDNEFHQCNGVEYLHEDELDLPDLWAKEGIPSRRLTSNQFDDLLPGVRRISGTIPFRLPMRQVRNPHHLAALVEACRRVGVGLTPNTPFGWWDRDGPSLAANTADGRRRTAGRYLIATGAWADEVIGPLGVRLRVTPVRGQVVLYNPGPRLFDHILLVGKRYLVPRLDGRVLVGSTEEPEAGFDKANTSTGIGELSRFARQLVPALETAAVEKTWSGLRPGSPDGMPFIGPVPGLRNVFAAVGHFRAGIQLSIGTAELVRDLILGRPTAIPAEPYRLDRVPDMTARPAFRS